MHGDTEVMMMWWMEAGPGVVLCVLFEQGNTQMYMYKKAA